MAKPAARIGAIQFAFVIGILAVLTRAAELQIVETERWAREAARQRTERVVLPARRGTLYDRNGVPLAITQEFYHVGIAPNELEDIRSAFVLLVRNLGVPAGTLNREFQARKRWIYLHGPFNATQVQPLRDVRGVHLTGEFQRFYPSRDLARPIIGSLSPERPGGAAGLAPGLPSPRRATAAVLIDTLSAPASSSLRMSSTVRTPPPTVSGMKHCSAVRATTSNSVSRLSELAVMSRKHSSSAPALS